MSSIERAMNKLSGTEPSSEEEAQAEQTAQATEATPPAVPPANTAVPPAQPAPEVAAAMPPPATMPPEDTPDETSNRVWIDFDRLEAAGNLSPETGLTRTAEEYQHIKRRLLGNIILSSGTNGRPSNLIMITSSVPSEGKTFTTMNLSMSLSMEMDHTVLVVDTDLMKRDLSRQLQLDDRPGLYDYLDEQVSDISEVIYRTNRSNLAVIPTGRYRSSSTELLASVRMRELVNEFATRYSDRVVFFDTPPLLATTTAVALAPMVGQLVLVVEAGETKTSTLKQALSVLDRTPVTGLILNKAKSVSATSYDYYGNYYRPGAEKS